MTPWQRGEAVSEAQLCAAWQERRYPPSGLVDSLRRRLHVVFPGRRWGGPGPDFRGALIALSDGTLLRGDVEVHRRSSGWVRHGHARDPRYASVILHVVREDDAPATDASGRPIATAVLPRPTLLAFPALAPCRRDAPAVRELVREAGRTRFQGRVARFEGDLAAVDADQVVWRGIAEGLGYSRNTAAFARLADAVPWADAARTARERGVEALATLLLGSAGLLDPCGTQRLGEWEALQAWLGARPALSAAAWERSALRPANDPVARCRGLAELAGRFLRQEGGSLAALVLGEVEGAAARARCPGLWTVVAASPWIGRGRAQTIVVNALLPFAAASGSRTAQELFERLPGEPWSVPTRYMAAQLGSPDIAFRTACERQGLLHLFKTACAVRACEACPAVDRRLPFAVTA